MNNLWNRFISLVNSDKTSLKKEELRLLGELALRIESIESHLSDNADDTVNKYEPITDAQTAQVDDALRNVKTGFFS